MQIVISSFGHAEHLWTSPEGIIINKKAVINSKPSKVVLIASPFNGFLLNSNKPIKSLQLEKLANQSMFNDVFTIEMINIVFFHKSKNNFRLIKRKNSDRKNMDDENDEF